MRRSEWYDLQVRTETTHTVQYLTETAAPDTATLVAVRSGKIISNRTQPTDDQIASTRPSTNSDSNVMLAASFGGSDGDSEYVESAENSTSRSTNTLDPVGHISKLEQCTRYYR